MNDKRFLAAVYSLEIRNHEVGHWELAEYLGVTPEEEKKGVSGLLRRGLLKEGEDGLRLTAPGRKKIKVVFIGGGFEIIHPGHLHTIREAKKLGDVLVVVAARDSTIRRRKGRKPISGEKERVELLSSIRHVDAAILGVEGDIYRTLERVNPDIVALGYDQYHLESDIEKEAAKRGMKLTVVRLSTPIPTVKTSSILKDF